MTGISTNDWTAKAGEAGASGIPFFIDENLRGEMTIGGIAGIPGNTTGTHTAFAGIQRLRAWDCSVHLGF